MGYDVVETFHVLWLELAVKFDTRLSVLSYLKFDVAFFFS
jgi:hypothetical protein